MPNRNRKTKTITKGADALKYFTDRYEACRRFAEYVNDDPPPERILFFCGDGGNGKSLLLKFLRERYCKRIDAHRWAAAKEAEVKEFPPFSIQASPLNPCRGRC